MKTSFVTLLALLFAFTCYSQKNIDTIYGNPRYVKEKVEFLKKNKQNYTFMEGDGDYGHATILTPENLKDKFHAFWFKYPDVAYINYEKEFLKNGKPKNETWRDKDEDFVMKYEYSYNKEGNLSEKKETFFDYEHNLVKYTYDYNGKLRSSISTYSDETDLFYYLLFKYDSIGNLIKTSRYDAFGYVNSDYKNYNKQNKLIREFQHIPRKWRENKNGSRLFARDSTGTWRNIKKLKYDVNDNLIYEERYNDRDIIRSKTIYKYDNDNIIERTIYNTPSDTSYHYKAIFKYNKLDLKIKEESIFSGRKEKTVTRIYDDNYIVHITIEEIGKTYNIDYKYDLDKKGNWIKIIKIVNDEPLYVWSRKIKYY
ncbi:MULTISPECIES: hypothetical protein [Winogradskyella]|uniref:hypothetical protein n=1 Tax=Winogradskyella TaxID=286104 RepID=UPI0015CE6E2F|nr:MULTISPECIES: hypothetical protein [Winogradskyella]QNK76610.1 hypothetical protein H7F37_10740 [Winogradskyella sp. PAMC22761]QXP77439.1 hypothetical protein H0I32_09355 [Winogradskyella sp. HaHa_3_26]